MHRKNRMCRIAALCLVLTVVVTIMGCQSQSDQPQVRYGARIIFDPVEERFILFGGRAEGSFGLKYLDDLWAFDYSTQTWAPVNVPKGPAGRLSPGMVYDPVHHQIILFGGLGPDGRLGDTWVYDFVENRWMEVTSPGSPPPRSDTGMAYDGINQVVILFGGYCQEGSRESCNDTWSYDPKTLTWTAMSPELAPPIMYGHTLVYDYTSRLSVLWGGHMSAVNGGQVSSLGYGNTFWSYDAVENTWQEVGAASAANPPARYWHAAEVDSTNGGLLLFGGDGGRGFLADTWRFDPEDASWSRVLTHSAPSPRVNAAVAFNPVNQVFLLFGGLEEDGAALQDTWVLERTDSAGQPYSWTQIHP